MMYRFTGLQRFAVTFLFVSALVLSIMIWVNGIPSDPFVLVMVCAMTLGLWFPLYLYVADTMRSVGGWQCDGGCWKRTVWFRDAMLDVYVERKARTKASYYVTFMADDSDYWGDECRTVVWEYKDYGELYNVLSNAEVQGINLLARNYDEDPPF
jgi:hypothetical protein